MPVALPAASSQARRNVDEGWRHQLQTVWAAKSENDFGMEHVLYELFHVLLVEFG